MEHPSSPQSPNGDRPATNPQDLVYPDAETHATFYELAIKLPNGIRGTLMIRCEDGDQNITLAIDGPATTWATNRKV